MLIYPQFIIEKSMVFLILEQFSPCVVKISLIIDMSLIYQQFFPKERAKSSGRCFFLSYHFGGVQYMIFLQYFGKISWFFLSLVINIGVLESFSFTIIISYRYDYLLWLFLFLFVSHVLASFFLKES